MAKKIKIPRERNPFLAKMLFRVSGPHGKTKKAERRADKVSLKRELAA